MYVRTVGLTTRDIKSRVRQIAIFNYFVLRTRKDLQVSPQTLFMFPFYRTMCLIFRLYALLENVINYSSWAPKRLRISTREETTQDLPPVPPLIDPDWYSIWHIMADNSSNALLTNNMQKLCKRVLEPIKFTSPKDKRRLASMIQAYILFDKMMEENKRLGFPRCLTKGSYGPSAHAASNGSERGSGVESEVQMLENAMHQTQMQFHDKLRELTEDSVRGRGAKNKAQSHWARVNNTLQRVISAWRSEENMCLFYSRKMQEKMSFSNPDAKAVRQCEFWGREVTEARCVDGCWISLCSSLFLSSSLSLSLSLSPFLPLSCSYLIPTPTPTPAPNPTPTSARRERHPVQDDRTKGSLDTVPGTPRQGRPNQGHHASYHVSLRAI